MGEYSKGKATMNRALAVYKSGALMNVNTVSPRVPEVLLCLGESLVVILDYALTA